MVDLIIIGGGPAGYHAALKASKEGLTTVLVSDGRMGGVCLHSGCIPSKTVLHSTNLSRDHGDFAIYGGPHPVDLPVLRERISGIVNTLERGITSKLARNNVRILDDVAEILPNRDKYFTIKAGSEILMSRYLLIATGSKERSIDIPGVEKVHRVTSSDLLDCESIPQSLLIVGAGSVGIEMGTAFARMGSQVTIVEQNDRIASHFDSDLTRILRQELEKEGVAIFTEATVSRFKHGTAEIVHKGTHHSVPADRVLFALGRSARSDIEGLSDLNIATSDDGNISVTSCGETTQPHCYAAGDVTGNPMLAHAAYSEAERVIDHILGKTVSPNHPHIPSVLYSSPELASVGLSESDATYQGIPVVVKRRPLGGNGRFLAETSGERGICKVVIHAENGQILGVHLAMPHASELIIAATIMVAQKLTARDLANCIFPHPTMGEIIKQCIVEEI